MAASTVRRFVRNTGCSRRPSGLVVTRSARAVVIGIATFSKPLVRIVAGQARKRSSAFSKASALAEINGLVPDVPRVIPVDRSARLRRWAMAIAAKLDEFQRRHSLWIPDRASGLRHLAERRGFAVLPAGPMARLA